jgi:hypothetical protein
MKKIFISKQPQAGSIALEYLIVSVFSFILTVAALGYVSKITQTKLEALSKELGIEFSIPKIFPWD